MHGVFLDLYEKQENLSTTNNEKQQCNKTAA